MIRVPFPYFYRCPFGSKTDPDFPLDDAYVFQVNIVIAYPIVILGVFSLSGLTFDLPALAAATTALWTP